MIQEIYSKNSITKKLEEVTDKDQSMKLAEQLFNEIVHEIYISNNDADIQSYIDSIDFIQIHLATLLYKDKFEINGRMRLFVENFDRLDDPGVRSLFLASIREKKI